MDINLPDVLAEVTATTDRIPVAAPAIVAQDDTIAPANGTSGNNNAGNIFSK